MKSYRYAMIVMWALAAAALAVSPARAQQASAPAETFSVEIDVFSGRPNPTFTVDLQDLAPFLVKLRSLCSSAASPASPYPAGYLGYRGVFVHRSGAHSIALGRKGALFAAANAPTVCQDKVSAAADLLVGDPSSDLERHLVELAHQKGAVDDVVHGTIVNTLNQAK
jgi:hypothetical protein